MNWRYYYGCGKCFLFRKSAWKSQTLKIHEDFQRWIVTFSIGHPHRRNVAYVFGCDTLMFIGWIDVVSMEQTHINPRHLQKLFGFGWKHMSFCSKNSPRVVLSASFSLPVTSSTKDSPRQCQGDFDLRDGPLVCRLSFCTSGDEQIMIMMWLWYDHLENRSVYVTEILTMYFGSQDLDPDHIVKALWATFMSWASLPHILHWSWCFTMFWQPLTGLNQPQSFQKK